MEKLTQHKVGVIYDEYGNIIKTMIVKDGEDVETVQTKRSLTDKQKYMINKNKDMGDFIKCNEGSYFHSIYRYNYPYLCELQQLDEGNKNNLNVIRMIILSTYLGFKDEYIRYKSRKIKKSCLKNIWCTSSRNSINGTYEKLIACNYIEEDDEGFIMINKNIFVHGKVDGYKKLKKDDDDMTYTRLFDKNIQEMYYNTKEKQRRQLGNLFKILPWINFKYNIFCKNPKETDRDKLEFMTFQDLALICGYDSKKHLSRFKNDLLNTSVYNYSTIGQFLSKNNKYYICVNPKVYYGGSNVEDVKFIYTMFEMLDNN